MRVEAGSINIKENIAHLGGGVGGSPRSVRCCGLSAACLHVQSPTGCWLTNMLIALEHRTMAILLSSAAQSSAMSSCKLQLVGALWLLLTLS